MKNKLILLSILILLALPLAAAYPVTMQLNGNMNFNTAVYHCSGSACTSLGSLYASGSGNPTGYIINNEGSGTQYFAEYDYVTDRCYVSHSYTSWFDESTGNGPWSYDLTFSKENDCEAGMDSLNYDNEITDGETQEIKVNVESPFDLHASGPQTVPSGLEYFYSTNAEANVVIKKAGVQVYEETKNSDILWSTAKEFTFNFMPAENGVYEIIVKTRVNDCMCSSYVEQEETGSFEVNYSPAPANNPPTAEITSPTDSSAFTTDDLILFEGTATDTEDGILAGSSLQWFSSIEGNIGQGNTFSKKLGEGVHTISLVATDSEGETDTYAITIEIIPTTPPADTIPPVISIISPESEDYDTTDILVEISASDEHLKDIWFFDGTNYHTYTGPVYMTFPEGANEIIAWADDEAGNENSASVSFNVALSDDNGDDGAKKSKRVKIEISDIELQNTECGSLTKITFRIENNGNRREDVLLKVKNSELGINELRTVTLEEDEEEVISFYFNIPSNVKDKLYYLDITAESRSTITEDFYPLRVKCEGQATSYASTYTSSAGSQETGASGTQAGITGNVIAAIGKGIVSPQATIALLGILCLVALLAVIAVNRK